jgi:hypothetical protein
MGMVLKRVFLAIAVLDVVVLNIFFLYFLYGWVSNNDPDLVSGKKEVELVKDEGVMDKGFEKTSLICDDECKKVIQEEVQKIIIPASTVITPTPSLAKKSVARNAFYYPIPGSGSTTNTQWTDVAGSEFYLNISDFSGFKEAYLEVNMKLFNGNGAAYARLYDITNSRAVDGSEVTTTSQTSTAVTSGKISIWRGNNKYRLQVKSLTSDTTVIESARMKIITEIEY